MVAKLIVHEPTRDEAIMTGLRALSEYLILESIQQFLSI